MTSHLFWQVAFFVGWSYPTYRIFDCFRSLVGSGDIRGKWTPPAASKICANCRFSRIERKLKIKHISRGRGICPRSVQRRLSGSAYAFDAPVTDTACVAKRGVSNWSNCQKRGVSNLPSRELAATELVMTGYLGHARGYCAFKNNIWWKFSLIKNILTRAVFRDSSVKYIKHYIMN